MFSITTRAVLLLELYWLNNKSEFKDLSLTLLTPGFYLCFSSFVLFSVLKYIPCPPLRPKVHPLSSSPSYTLLFPNERINNKSKVPVFKASVFILMRIWLLTSIDFKSLISKVSKSLFLMLNICWLHQSLNISTKL